MTTKPPPEGYRTVTPYLVVDGAGRLIDFLSSAFGAAEVMRHLHPDGTIQHAEVRIGDSKVMVSEARDGHPPMTSMIFLYVDDADEAYRRALAAGATSLREPRDEPHGDRMAGVLDPVGVQWWVACRIASPASP